MVPGTSLRANVGHLWRNGGYFGATTAARQDTIHAAAFRRSAAISSNVRPSPSSFAFLP